MADIRLKRAYDEAEESDGSRLLVDGMWPRGIAKESLQITEWLRDLAPSKTLRQWFGHDPARWATFRERYVKELEQGGDAVERLKGYVADGRVTLVYAAKDEAHNNAVALRQWLEDAG